MRHSQLEDLLSNGIFDVSFLYVVDIDMSLEQLGLRFTADETLAEKNKTFYIT
jgi:hypothetical protein